MLFEVLAFTKFARLGFPALPRCKVVKQKPREDRLGYIKENITEIDVVLLVEELKDKPIFLVEVTTRETIKDMKGKLEKIQEACRQLKEEYWNEVFMPLVIVSREVMDYVKEVARSNIKVGSYERSLLVPFEFETFLSISSRGAFLEELKERLKL